MNPSTMTPSTPESDPAAPPLLLSSLGIHLKSESKKIINAIVLKGVGFKTRQISGLAIGPGGHHREEFDPPLAVLCSTKITISIQFRSVFNSDVSISLDPNDIINGAHQKEGEQVYISTKRDVEITIGIKSLPSVVKEIIASCSKFRLLIIGESGVGKSSLINKVFGVRSVDVSDNTRGEAAIDQEHTAQENDRFIVHDSRGFEAAEQGNLRIVREFISRRRAMPHLKDRLHAVWLCLTIPCAGGRLLEAGVEKFLKNREEILGDIPLIVVFTKFDLLVNTKRVEAMDAHESAQEDTLKKRAQESLEALCFLPLRVAAGSRKVPHVAVSTWENYERTLSELVEETTKNIRIYIKDEAPQYLAVIAQRVNIHCKVQATIAIGEKRYWSTLAASSNFTGHTLKSCLNTLHRDILIAWNFHDPNDSLQGEEFKKALLETRDVNIDIRKIRGTWEAAQESDTFLAALVIIITSTFAELNKAAIPIVVPITGFVVLGMLAHDLYKASQNTVRLLMAYIINLTCIMQILFLVTSVKNGGIVTVELVDLAMKVYEKSYQGTVHNKINNFPVDLAVVPGKRDFVLEKIKDMINEYHITDEQFAQLRCQARRM